MQIHLHNEAGQPGACLQSLVQAAQRLASEPRMRSTRSVAAVVRWIRTQPFLPDREDEAERRRLGARCWPSQRTRSWPTDGLNCWEATIHFCAAVLVHGLRPGVELHVYDVLARRRSLDLGEGVVLRRGRRHVYPALSVGEAEPRLVDLSSQRGEAQAEESAVANGLCTPCRPLLIRGAG